MAKDERIIYGKTLPDGRIVEAAICRSCGEIYWLAEETQTLCPLCQHPVVMGTSPVADVPEPMTPEFHLRIAGSESMRLSTGRLAFPDGLMLCGLRGNEVINWQNELNRLPLAEGRENHWFCALCWYAMRQASGLVDS